jgi:hypothetical protein
MSNQLNIGNEWIDWLQLCALKSSDIPTEPGAYLVATRSPLNRAAGTDSDGVIDIGESNHLRSRIMSFIGCATGKRKEGHMAGWRYFNFDFDTIFPFDSLWIRWTTVKTKEDAYKVEGELLHSYIDIYKELPPLNYKFNWTGYTP